MKNILEYKGYYTKIEYNAEDKVLHGKIEGISDLVTFESDNTLQIKEEFYSAVDDYLEFCLEVGKEPDKVFKGTFNVRIRPELHKEISIYAFKNDISLNSAVEKAVSSFLEYIQKVNTASLEITVHQNLVH